VRKWIALGASGLLLATLASGSAGAADAAGAVDGKKLYTERCGICHGDTGYADTKKGKAAKAKSFHETELAAKLTAADGEAVATKNVRTNKKHKNVTKKVTDEDLAAIAAYVKVLAATP
jgi:mono/diheme cytochrome c family protein